MPAPHGPPLALSEPLPLTVSTALEATSMPAEYCPAAKTELEPARTSVTSRSIATMEAFFALVSPSPSARFLSVRLAVEELAGTTRRKSPFVENPCTSASAVRVRMPVDFA
jgi:hypothetical protein